MADTSYIAEQIARIRRAQAESDEFVAEQRKLTAEQAKLQAEASRLLLNQDFSPWKIVAISIAMTVALIGASAIFTKLLCR